MITDYATLQTELAAWLNRDDLTARLPTFIQLFEATANRKLRVPSMMNSVEGSSSEDSISVPTDLLETYSLKLDSVAGPALEFQGIEAFEQMRTAGITGLTRYYTIINDAYRVLPAPGGDTEYELIYFKKIPALSDANTTNWLLLRSPDLYLKGGLLEATGYGFEDERVPVWADQVNTIFEEMRIEGERSRFPTTQLMGRRRSF